MELTKYKLQQINYLSAPAEKESYIQTKNYMWIF